MHEELAPFGFTVISVAEDKSADDARPWIEAAKPRHPSLIDTQHVVADLYNMVNVPTVVWIDEAGRIVRPNDVAFGSDMFKAVHGIEAERHKALLRAWVRGEATPEGASGALPADRARSLVRPPSADDQMARAEFGLAFWLYEQGRAEAAERHFLRAGELAPHDFMIRRGSMPIRGINSMGPEFFKMTQEWAAQGRPYYVPLED
jgi:hypothetical protein